MFAHMIRGTLNKTEPPRLLDERYMLESRALHYPPQHFLFDTFDRKLQQYIEADLINYNIRTWNEESDPKKYEEFEEPFAVLTLGELEAGFVVCLVPLILSILVFCIEWLPNLKAFLVFQFALRSFFKLRNTNRLSFL